jgi:hypothetical protein
MLGKICVLGLLLSLFIFPTSLLSSAMASPAVGSTTVTTYSLADAYVNSSSPDENCGNTDRLWIRYADCYSYVMFDLSTIPQDATIISADLQLYLTSIGGYVGNIDAHYCPDNSWNELDITWNNKPEYASEPTDRNYFGMFVILNRYESWDVTSDVRAALSQQKLTEVIIRESSGHAAFHSKEADHMPKLDVEYSTLPVFVVHLESAQDTGTTENLGFTTLADNTFHLPVAVDVVAGSYQAAYDGGYMFVRWETTGGITVSDAESTTTNVTVSSEGTLRAVGNVKRLEYAYDRGQSSSESRQAGYIDAVRFTPLFSGQLLTARFYIHSAHSYQPNTFIVHVMDENHNDMITPFERTATSVGWLDVSLSSHGISADEGRGFYIGIEWINDYNPYLGKDGTDPSDRSQQWNGTMWNEEENYDYMIRAIVGNLIDHVFVTDGTVFNVSTESNSTISNFQFTKEEKQISFELTGPSGNHSFCDVKIPSTLMWVDSLDEWIIKVNGTTLSLQERTITHNGTHYSIHFTCKTSTITINMASTYVIPEIPLLYILRILMLTALLAAIPYRKMKKENKRLELA